MYIQEAKALFKKELTDIERQILIQNGELKIKESIDQGNSHARLIFGNRREGNFLRTHFESHGFMVLNAQDFENILVISGWAE